MKSRTITFRLNEEEYQKCLKIALIRSNEEQRIVKISEIIRYAIKKGLKSEK